MSKVQLSSHITPVALSIALILFCSILLYRLYVTKIQSPPPKTCLTLALEAYIADDVDSVKLDAVKQCISGPRQREGG